MKIKKKLVTVALMIILTLAFASPVLAQGPDGAKVIFGENFTLEEGKTLNDDLIVFGGNVTLKEGSEVGGDIVAFGGNITIDGAVKGDVGAIGGNVNVNETAEVNGDIGMLGGHANIAEGAVVKGDVEGVTELNYEYDESRPLNGDNDDDDDDDDDGGFSHSGYNPSSDYDESFSINLFSIIGQVVSDIFWAIALIIVLALISWLVAAFMPEQMMTVRQALSEATPMSFGFGLLSSIVTIASILLICLLIPFLTFPLLGVAALFGWIVIGQIIGERLLTSSSRPIPNLAFSTIIGVSFLTFLTNLPVIGLIDCIGFIGAFVGLLVAITGVGAVLLTRFGTRPYPANSTYAYGGGPSPSPSPSYGFGGGSGSRVRWTEPAPEVSDEEKSASEVELNAKIKAALAETDGVDEPDQPKKPVDEPKDDPDSDE